jgi:hypothetical protein
VRARDRRRWGLSVGRSAQGGELGCDRRRWGLSVGRSAQGGELGCDRRRWGLTVGRSVQGGELGWDRRQWGLTVGRSVQGGEQRERKRAERAGGGWRGGWLGTVGRWDCREESEVESREKRVRSRAKVCGVRSRACFGGK